MAGIKNICAWCQAELDPAEEGDALAGELISHGICQACLEQLFAEYEAVGLLEFINSIALPVIVLGPDAEVHAANEKACTLLCKQYPANSKQKSGDFIACANAKKPGGCGKTIHCRTCTIRNCIEKTYETGIPFARVPAIADISSAGSDTETVKFLITTEKIKNVVLLRIDEMSRD